MEPLKKNLSVVSIAAGLALALSACGEDSSATQAPAEDKAQERVEAPGGSPAATPDATEDTSSSKGDGKPDARAAVETAVAEVDNGTAVELDFSDDRKSWEVELVSADTEQEVRVSPDGSEVLGQEWLGEADEEDRSELQGAKVTLAEALGAAQQEAAGEIKEASLDDDENDIPVWEVEVRVEKERSEEVRINAATGEPIR
ncbi:propeptide PepSY amd peptidase M4 [Arthrobacter crystallopoietes BAB-32]|uniref:Propeptide PepSY amd peptidase M4 n=1 Tax=Arthrobacter crystallopoietes BAB-32 TaxID=1246476 RepID=N1V2I8_9MICC|nr:PepSY domain-containing protein [Arthrobacter crystallopoietes]EMY32468.1 propeptide PepSY amd peptidase M4 [Arthrobacter crystallopoietes BAB-32]